MDGKNDAPKYNRLLAGYIKHAISFGSFRKVETPDPSSKNQAAYCDKVLKTLLNEEYIEKLPNLSANNR